MNIVQLHERVRFWLDMVASPRYESEDVDNALNSEIDFLVNEKYDQSGPFNRPDAFQRTQKIRDQLRNLVKKLGTDEMDIDTGNNLLSLKSTVEDYRYMLCGKVKFTVAGTWHNCIPLVYDRLNVISKNPFRRVRTTPYSKVYVIESESGWEIIHGFSGDTIGDCEFYYLADPAIVNYGIEYDSGKTFANGNVVIAVEETVYAGVTYVIGEKFTITSPNYSITSGLVVFSFVESDLPPSLHEEICRRAAASILRTAKEFDKSSAVLTGAVS